MHHRFLYALPSALLVALLATLPTASLFASAALR